MITGPFDDDGVFNVSTSDESSVACVVADVQPKPLISWFVDDVQLIVENVTDSPGRALFLASRIRFFARRSKFIIDNFLYFLTFNKSKTQNQNYTAASRENLTFVTFFEGLKRLTT